MKEQLADLVSEKSVNGTHTTMSLLLAVLLKYGIAPIALIYLGWIVVGKDEVIQKNHETVVSIVREQTTATANNTTAIHGLNRVIEINTNKLDEIEKERRNERSR